MAPTGAPLPAPLLDCVDAPVEVALALLVALLEPPVIEARAELKELPVSPAELRALLTAGFDSIELRRDEA